MSAAKSFIQEASRHLDRALEHHANGEHADVKRAVQRAKEAIGRAISAPADPVANPTAAMGAQTSNGPQPRDYSPQAIRARDQRRAVEHAYEQRTGAKR